MKPSLSHTAGLVITALALAFSVLKVPTTLRGDEMGSLSSDEQYAKFVDEWFERLSDAEPQSIATEFAAMSEAASEIAWADRWPLAVAIRMVEQDSHFEHAAAYLLDYVESGHDHPTIDLNQSVMDKLVPTLLDRLVSRVPPVFESVTKWVARFQQIPDQYSADIRGLIWDWTDDPFKQVEGCRLLARLANVTQADRDAIVACLESPDNIVVEAALQASVTIGDTTLLPEIQKRLNHVSEGVSIEAATAMLQIIEGHPNDASLSPLTIQALETLNKQYLAGHRQEVLEHAKRVPHSMLSLPDLLRDVIELPAEKHDVGFFVFDSGLHVSASEILDAAASDALSLIGEWLVDSNTPVIVRLRLLRNLQYIEADQSALHSIVVQQLESENEEVRTQAIRLLTQYGHVDASLLVNLKTTSETGRLTLMLALGQASEATRQSAIELLRKYLDDKSPDVRVAAAVSLVKLGDVIPEVRRLPGQLIEDLDELTWDYDGWNGLETLKDLTKQLTPSPEGLATELLRAAQACPKPELDNDGDEMENEQIEDRAKGVTIAQRAAELLGSVDDSAFDARVELSRHSDGNIRQQAILQLGASGDSRALFPIVTHLFDRSQYSFMISLDFGDSAELRLAAIESLANPQLDVSSIAPMLCDLLEEDWAALHAAQALGRCQSQSEQILTRLKDIKLLEPDERAIAIGATSARLEKDDSRRWQAMVSVLRLLRQPQHAAGVTSNSYRAPHFLLETLQSLHREGISIEPLRAELEFLAVDQSCLDFETRAAIVTILAETSPKDPRWLNMLKFWRAQEDMKYGPADQLIDSLPEGLQHIDRR